MLDAIDVQILGELQKNCAQSLTDLGSKVHLSRNAVWRRLARLEDDGYIIEKVARLDRERLNLGFTVFMEIRTDTHSLDWINRFHSAVRDIPEFVGIYRMSGDVDYLLQAVIPDMKSYDQLYKKLISRIELSDVSSRFVMEEIKQTSQLPLDYL